MSTIRDVVVPLYEVRGPDWKGLGTAAIIGSFGHLAMFVTAKHILERLVDELSSLRPKYPPLSQAAACIWAPEPFLAEITRVSISDFTDIGLGLLVAPTGKQFGPPLAIDPSPALPGTKIHALGYPGLPINHLHDWDAEHFQARLEFRLAVREGAVISRHPGGIRRLKWPVFQVDASLDSGMSGGPILELRGTEPVLRGIISSDLSVGDDLRTGSGDQAFASELWPILMSRPRLVHDFVTEDETPLAVETLLDMIREGFIHDRGSTIEKFIWEPTGDTVTAGWRGIPGLVTAPLPK